MPEKMLFNAGLRERILDARVERNASRDRASRESTWWTRSTGSYDYGLFPDEPGDEITYRGLYDGLVYMAHYGSDEDLREKFNLTRNEALNQLSSVRREDMTEIGPEELSGIERIFYSQSHSLLEERRQANKATPVIMVDVGGMVGLSMMRLAAQPDFISAIDDGRLVIVISNYEYVPTSADELLTHTLTPLAPVDRQLVQDQFHRVHFVMADAQELKRIKVSVPGRPDPVSLRGGVDIVHEHFVITHSKKPDIDLPHLGKLLSKSGTLFCDATGTTDGHIDYMPPGVINLENSGLRRLDFGKRPTSYAVFQHLKAPPLALAAIH